MQVGFDRLSRLIVTDEDKSMILKMFDRFHSNAMQWRMPPAYKCIVGFLNIVFFIIVLEQVVVHCGYSHF